METDASGSGLGAVLEQEQEDGELHPVAYASRSLTPAEKRYGVSEMEALGVVCAIRHFRPYLLGHETVVYTDHSALKSLLNTSHPSGKLARWGMALQEISPEIRYRPGRKNGNADALSRTPTGPTAPVGTINTEGESSRAGDVLQDESDALPGIAKEQRQDQYYGAIISYMENGVLPDDEKLAWKIVLLHPNFELIDGILCLTESRPPYRVRVAVSEKLRPILLAEAHSGRFSGHFAEKSLYGVLSRRYWWEGMRGDVRRQCRSCLACVSRTGGGPRVRPTLKPIPVGGPFHRVRAVVATNI